MSQHLLHSVWILGLLVEFRSRSDSEVMAHHIFIVLVIEFREALGPLVRGVDCFTTRKHDLVITCIPSLLQCLDCFEGRRRDNYSASTCLFALKRYLSATAIGLTPSLKNSTERQSDYILYACSHIIQ